MAEEIKLTVTEGVESVLIGQQNTPFQHQESETQIFGTITSPANFYEGRGKTDAQDCGSIEELYLDWENQGRYIVNSDAIIYIYEEEGKIKLVVGMNSNRPIEVMGSMKLNPNFEDFKINTEETWGIKSLRKFLRRQGRFISNEENAFDKLIGSLMEFTSNVNKKVESYDDSQGNKKETAVTEVVNSVPLFFNMKIAPYKGEAELEFKVDILVEVTKSNDIVFYFDSIELEEKLESLKNSVLKRELERIPDVAKIIV